VKPIAYCLELHDLVLAKCAAGRERNWDYALEMLKRESVELGELLGGISAMPLSAATQEHMTKMLRGIGVQLG
jgi:hypothetical protein